MNSKRLSHQPFLKHVVDHNSNYFLIALILGILYFLGLRLLYPIPSFYSDSYTWISAAKHNQPVTFRPIGYSKFLQFFKLISYSDVALIAAQYFSNLLANLFLFFTCTYFFRFKKPYKIALFALLICNPFYLLYSNYVSSDAFFCSLLVIWFTLLIWILDSARWQYLVAQLLLLAVLFQLRFNAVIVPLVGTIGILLIRDVWWKKTIYIVGNFLLIASLVFIITRITAWYTGTKTFSGFSGWQLANNAMHVLRDEKLDPINIHDQKTKELVVYVGRFFDTASGIPKGATAWYMWDNNSPLKKYLSIYTSNNIAPFRAWNALGPVYSTFAKTVIIKKPFSYVAHFVLPNAHAYFFPSLEAYETYMAGSDTIAHIAQEYYYYGLNKTPRNYPIVYAVVFKPWKYLFPFINFAFIAFSAFYFGSKGWQSEPKLFNRVLLCFTALFLSNFFFIVLLAPSVLRYHIFILTLGFPFILYLVQSLFERQHNTLSTIAHEVIAGIEK